MKDAKTNAAEAKQAAAWRPLGVQDQWAEIYTPEKTAEAPCVDET